VIIGEAAPQPQAVTVKFKLNKPQFRYMRARRKYKYVAYVAGFGSGKTYVGCTGLCEHFLEHPKLAQGYFAPTYPHIRDIFYPTIEEVAHAHGMRVKINESNKEVHMYRGRWYYGTTICRSIERPSTIVGFKIANALIDELDVVNHDKARLAWRKIIARLRYQVDGVRNGVDVTTTPEGFKFVYEQFVEQVRKKPELAELYHLVQASTWDNGRNLPADYIASLLSSYPVALISAYLNGQFVNLTSGTVYHAFNRIKSFTTAREQAGEPLHFGMDFNVGKMAAIAHVQREGRPYAVREFVDIFDTPAMISKIKAEYPDGTRQIFVYPDASGDNRKSMNASETDLSLLRAAGFTVLNNPANPPVRDRILCMNRQFDEGYKVNPDTCPRYVEGLERQAYDKYGNPDKSSGFDHGNDAGGYFITWRYPLTHNRIERITLKGK
jgi:hypothetical protein